MLAHLLEGVWINQDEFSHRGKGAKKAFLTEISSVAKDKKVPVLIVDKINTMRQHRQDILEAMQKGASGDVVFVQLAHPLDEPGSLKHQMQLCLARIRARGDGHRTLMGSDPKLQGILRMAASGSEPMLPQELEAYLERFVVDVTLPPAEAMLKLLATFDECGLLGRFNVDELVTQARVEEALRASLSKEEEMGGGSSGPPTSSGGSSDAGKKKKKSGKPAPLWI